MSEINTDAFILLNPGTLIDSEIIRLCKEGKLITHSFDHANVKQACYELRASNLFFETQSEREDKRVQIRDGEAYALRPHSYVTAIVMESLDLPANVLGRILTKGQLFSIGLLPVNTYADPGFRGQLGITLCNMSHRYLLIRPGQTIAKIEFSVLPSKVDRPYAGQHGFATGIWPIPFHLIAKPDELERLHIKTGSHDELARSYGQDIATLARRFQFYERKVWLHLFLTVSLFLAAVGYFGSVDWVLSLALGVAGNLLTHLAFWLASER